MIKLQVNTLKERILFLSPSVNQGKERECIKADFEELSELGSGSFGVVQKVKHKATGKIYARKQISKQQIKAQKLILQLRNEVKILYCLDHPNITKLYNHYEEEKFFFLLLEYVSGGHLFFKLNQVGRFEEQTVIHYMRDICSAIAYLHSRNPAIIHRDIKPENILIDENNHVKLADFGWSNYFSDTKQRKTYCGTMDYLAPEMILMSGHDKSLDIWMLGVLIYELIVGRAPFSNSNHDNPEISKKELENRVLNVQITFPNDFPQLLKDLVLKILRKNPKDRIVIEDILIHPWFNQNSTQPIVNEKSSAKRSKSNKRIFDPNIEPLPFTKEELEVITSRRGSVVNETINQSTEISDENQRDYRSERLSKKSQSYVQESKTIEPSKTKILDHLVSELKLQDEEINNLEIQIELMRKQCIDIEAEGSSNDGDLKAKIIKQVNIINDENSKIKSEIIKTRQEKSSILKEIFLKKNNLTEISNDVKNKKKLSKKFRRYQKSLESLKETISSKDLAIEELKKEIDNDSSSISLKVKQISLSSKITTTNIITTEDFEEIEKELMEKILGTNNSNGEDIIEQFQELVSQLQNELDELVRLREHEEEEIEFVLPQEIVEQQMKLTTENELKLAQFETELLMKKTKTNQILQAITDEGSDGFHDEKELQNENEYNTELLKTANIQTSHLDRLRQEKNSLENQFKNVESKFRETERYFKNL